MSASVKTMLPSSLIAVPRALQTARLVEPRTQPIHLLYPQLMESDLAPDAGEVPAVFVVAQQAPDMQ